MKYHMKIVDWLARKLERRMSLDHFLTRNTWQIVFPRWHKKWRKQVGTVFQPHNEGIRLLYSPWNTTSFVLKIRVKHGESLQKEREIRSLAIFPSCKLVASCMYFSRETTPITCRTSGWQTSELLAWQTIETSDKMNDLNNNWSSFYAVTSCTRARQRVTYLCELYIWVSVSVRPNGLRAPFSS